MASGDDADAWMGQTALAGSQPGVPDPGAAPPALQGELLGERFQILGIVGVGGMGTVYRVRDVVLDEVIALKMLRPDLVASPPMLEQFRREVKLARRVTHHNVARAFDIGEHGDRRFLTMELVDGESLAAVVAREGALAPARVAALVEPLCAGLAAAHAAGVIHRDLKPDNVLVATDGRVVITDFGIAAVRAELRVGSGVALASALTGTPAYMAPEQVEGAAVDARTDLYALGAMLFELLTGTRPFAGTTPVEVATARLSGIVPDPSALRPDIPAELGAIVRRCMALRPADRFARAEDVASAVAQAVAAAPAAAPVTAPPTRPVLSRSVAVLPFHNAGLADDDYLADGFTDDMIDLLSMARGMRVRARGAVMRYKGDARDPRELGRELGVDVIVHGAVLRHHADRLRVTARMTSVADGFQVWARRFDGPAGELLAMTDETARALAEALAAAEPERSGVTRDPIAVELYLRGRYEYHKLSPVGAGRAVDLLQQAATRAPDDATILAGLAMALARGWNFTLAVDSDMDARAMSAAVRAAALAPQRGEPHLALAMVLKLRNDWPGMARALRDALQRAPELADALEMRGGVLFELGDEAAGGIELERAMRLDPQIIQPLVSLGRQRELLGDRAGAERYMERVAQVDRGTLYETARARLTVWRRDRDAARAQLARLPGLTWFMPHYLLGALLGEPMDEMEREIIRQATETGVPRRRSFFYQLQAELAALDGRADDALAALTRAVDFGLIDVPWIDRCPLLEPLRADARFVAERARVEQRVRELRALL